MKPSIPKGTRDFSPEEVAKRNYIFKVATTHFERFGFQPIQTPSFEKSETLLGKYGEEGDRLIFKILDSGGFLKKVDDELYAEKDSSKISSKISGKALRYDLTVPFARYVVQHQNEIDFPFKRYQIQPVWRADRPQKGRFREFFQCDADMVGGKSLWQEVELIQLYDAVFSDLKLKGTRIKMNHRKILSGFAETIGAGEKLVDFTTALDKLDKIGKEQVKNEMREKGISSESLKKIDPIFDLSGTFSEQITGLKKILAHSEIGKKGISELEFIYSNVNELSLQNAELSLDVTLARGLDYYTGAIIEVLPPENVKMGSIGGGGRYDDLTGNFGLKNMSGVGISFGLDRIYLVLEELNLFPKSLSETTKALFLNFGEKESLYCLKAIKKLRENNISAELYPDPDKMKKQMNYANKRNLPFVVLAGSKEMEEGIFTLKNMRSGEQHQVDLMKMINLLEE